MFQYHRAYPSDLQFEGIVGEVCHQGDNLQYRFGASNISNKTEPYSVLIKVTLELPGIMTTLSAACTY